MGSLSFFVACCRILYFLFSWSKLDVVYGDECIRSSLSNALIFETEASVIKKKIEIEKLFPFKLSSLRCYNIQIEDTITVSSFTKRYPLKSTYATSYPMNESGEDIKKIITQQLKFKLRFQTRRKKKKS